MSALEVNCTDVVTSYINTVPQLQEKLYCGYRQAKCDGSSVANQYSTAFDWQTTSPSYFQPNIYYNDTMGLTGGGRTLYQRLPEALNMAVNSWVSRALGEDGGRGLYVGTAGRQQVLVLRKEEVVLAASDVT